METRANVLRTMKICRFCLREDDHLTNIYERQKDSKHTVPLPLQLMACVAIEVFPTDGMPQLICSTCRSQTQQAYLFKTNCKKADDALKIFLSTGALVRPCMREDTVTEQPPQRTVQGTKRTSMEEVREQKPKKAKSEMITLNYTNSLSQNLEQSNDSIPEPDGPEQQFESSMESHEDGNDDSQSNEVTDFMNLEEESLLNPTLKVDQVKTDCFPCSHCERSFPLKQLLDLHMSNHARERNYNCEECDKSFFTKYDLSKHLLTHTGCKPFICVVCNKSFLRESLLHRHEKIHVDVPKYLCNECDKTFLTGEDLDAHAVKHKKKRPFACKICQKSFVFKQGLERHELSHSNVKPHKCNYCEASFTSAIKLTRHVTSHAGLRPYPCKICGRTFLLSHHLTRHMRSHYAAQQPESYMPPVGQHKCDICSMSFRRKDSLINHSAIHSMVNLKCVICNTEFDDVYKVKDHITTHLTDLPFPCERCDYSFDTQEQLEDHELKHAEMEYEDQIEQEVIAEARQAASQRDSNEEDNSDYSDEVAEFTITNDINNPEVVRRSKRAPKVKNYAEFLKDELGSDLEETIVENDDDEEEEDEMQHEEESDGEKEVDPLPSVATHSRDEDVIKPIVRSEGTKVYSRKNFGERPKITPQINLPPVNINASLNKITQPSVNPLDQLATAKDLRKMPNKEIYNMKIGDKTVTVQKLFLTKEQMEAMAREGKIEKKGNTLLLRKAPGQVFQTVNMGTLMGKTSAPAKAAPSKKTYQRKAVEESSNVLDSSISAINFDEQDSASDAL